MGQEGNTVWINVQGILGGGGRVNLFEILYVVYPNW